MKVYIVSDYDGIISVVLSKKIGQKFMENNPVVTENGRGLDGPFEVIKSVKDVGPKK